MTDDRTAAGEDAHVTATSADPESLTAEGGHRYTRRPVRNRPLGCLIEIAETLILTLVIFWVIQTFVAQPFQVQQDSMSGTLEEGQYVLVDKLTPHFDSHSRGDIVVFNPVTHDEACTDPSSDIPAEGDTPFIKRVIGQPGDTVTIQDGSVFVNGVEIDEPYIHGARTTQLSDEDTWTVPADRLFVMGDNRTESSDSRSFGPICIREVVGRAWLRYWPLSTLGILQTPTYPNVPAPEAARVRTSPATPSN